MNDIDPNNIPLAVSNKVLNRVIGTQTDNDGISTFVLYPIKSLLNTGAKIIKITTTQTGTDENNNILLNLTVYTDDGNNYSSPFSIPHGPNGLSISKVNVEQDDVSAGETSTAKLTFYSENNTELSSVNISLPPGVNSSAVDNVSAEQTAVNPGEATRVTITTTYLDNTVKTYSFDAPPGVAGAQGPDGIQGIQGEPGKDNSNISNITVEQTEPTPGKNTTITITQSYDDNSSKKYSYVIPPGDMGAKGEKGETGPQGPQGPIKSEGSGNTISISNLVSEFASNTSNYDDNVGLSFTDAIGTYLIPNNTVMQKYVRDYVNNNAVSSENGFYYPTSIGITDDDTTGNNSHASVPVKFLKINMKEPAIDKVWYQLFPSKSYLEDNYIGNANDSGLIISSLSLTDSSDDSSPPAPSRNFLIIHYHEYVNSNKSYYQTVPTMRYVDSLLEEKISTYTNGSKDVAIKGMFKNSDGNLQIDFVDGTWGIINL